MRKLLWKAAEIIVAVLFFWPALAQPPVAKPPLPVLDCREARVQAGVPVRRNSDGRITRIDVCAAADSPIDTFRDIPYQPTCDEYPTGMLCY